ncbi:unnamed protein product [Orchesella dallaii]|uniref:Death domain-containing protein n=1 Tax=Orchesella dallaii TaxID=48710 RepID=A0ABP1QK68_9HEXA
MIQTLFSGFTNSEYVRNWCMVANTLGVPSEKTGPFRANYNNGTLPIKELYEDVLTAWTGVKGNGATVSALIKALETLRDAASSSNEGSGSGGCKTSSTKAMDEKSIRHTTKKTGSLFKSNYALNWYLNKAIVEWIFFGRRLGHTVTNNPSENVLKLYSLFKTRIEAYDTIIAAFSCQVKVAEIMKEVYDS